jgi:hypothetical protein
VFVSADGRRCGSTNQLEYHHVASFAKGGPATVANLGLMCKCHNAFHTEEDLGAEGIASLRRS